MITAEMFKAATGIDPEEDDLDRCNCPHAGEEGHWHCGWDAAKNRPQFYGVPVRKERATMPPQQIFTTAFLGVIGQGCFSVDASSTCLYRGPNGAKCPVGWLIDDALAASFGTLTICHVPLGILPAFIATNLGLCHQMQEAHDIACYANEGIPGFCDRMLKVAARFNLEVPNV